MPEKPSEITALVLTYNSERLIRPCLESLAFCDRIVTIDSHSTDATREISAECGAEVLVRRWEGPGPQLRFGLEHIAGIVEGNPQVRHWVLCFDSDEICDPLLQASIKEAVNRPSDKQKACTAFALNRLSWYFDRFMRHSSWHPDWLYRLFVFGELEIKMSGAHYSFHPKGESSKLQGKIYHYPYTGFANQLEKLNSYAEQGATDLRRQGRRGGVIIGLLHAMACFFRKYILKLGFLDGKAGFILALHDSFYTFVKYVRVLESTWGKPFDHAFKQDGSQDKKEHSA